MNVLQLLFGVDVGVARGNVVHIGNQNQPALAGLGVVEFVLAIFLFDDLQDFFGMKLIKQRKTVLQKQKNALVVGRSSNMFFEFGSFVIGNGR